MSETWEHVVCPGCACLCDDIRLTLEDQQLVDFSPHCAMGRRWFSRHMSSPPSPFEVRGKSESYATTLKESAVLIEASDYPLVYGLSRSSTPGQRAAVELAESLGGVVDTTASLCHGPSIMALQEFGEVTCTLGEIRNRADLVIFWGCNPADSHPRHAERYSVHPRGRFLPAGRADRKVVMIGDAQHIDDWSLDSEGTEPDLRIAVESGRDFELLSMIKMMLQGTNTQRVPDEILSLMKMIRECQYGVLFFGLGLAETGAWGGTRRTGTGHINVAALLSLVAELNSVTRFTARRMRLQGDVSGADNVLTWQTSYPFAVDFSRGFPRYNPGEFTANELLERRDVDLAIIVGAETIPYFTEEARKYLESIPKIILDYAGVDRTIDADAYFTTATYGIHAAGTAYRMDNVPLPLHKLIHSDLPTDEDVLLELLGRHRESTAHE